MKKVLLFICCLFATMTALADSAVKSGNASVLKEAGANFSVEIDFTHAKIEDKSYKAYLKTRDEEWNQEWPGLVEEGRKAFIKAWNGKNKKGMTAVTGKTAPYRLVIKPSDMNLGNLAMSYFIGFGAGGMKMSGTIELYKGSKKVLVISVKDQTGRGTKEKARIKSLFKELAQDTYEDVVKK